VQYKFPPINYALGKSGTDNIGTDVTPSDKPWSHIDVEASWNVELQGASCACPDRRDQCGNQAI
jgi:hypothetical protein